MLRKKPSQAEDKVEILKILKSLGRRLTPVLRGLIQIFLENKSPLTSTEIVQRLKSEGNRANKTTVYRQLELLCRSGIVQEVQFADRKGRYELVVGRLDHHHHLVCLKCGKVTDIDLNENITSQEKIIWKKKKFRVERHSLEFFGVCRGCQTGR